MSERTTIRLPEDLLNRARRKAAAEGRTLHSLIEEGLRVILSESPKPAKRKRVMLGISKAAGGLMREVNLTSTSALQQAGDLEFVRRMWRSE